MDINVDPSLRRSNLLNLPLGHRLLFYRKTDFVEIRICPEPHAVACSLLWFLFVESVSMFR